MHLSELLNHDAIDVDLQTSDKRETIAKLVERLEKAHGLSTGGEILDRVLKREGMMSTGIGNGIAIPHGKARSVDRLVAACAVSRKGVDFEAVDQESVFLLILLVSPEDVGGPHVKVLANISRLLKEDSVRELLKGAESPDSFLTHLRESENKYL